MATRRPQIWSWKFRWYICLILCSRFSSSVNRQPPPWVKDDTMYGLDVHAKCWDLSKQLQICFFGHVCHAFAIALWCSTWWYMTISYNKKNKSERSFISFHLPLQLNTVMIFEDLWIGRGQDGVSCVVHSVPHQGPQGVVPWELSRVPQLEPPRCHWGLGADIGAGIHNICCDISHCLKKNLQFWVALVGHSRMIEM